MRAVAGEVLDVAVDILQSSPIFGQWVSCIISAKNKRMLWGPERFAHGLIIVPSDEADFLYKTTDYYAPQDERSIRCNDPDIGIDWQLTGQPMLSKKDKTGVLLKDTEVFS